MSSPFPWRPEARQEKTLVTAAPRPPEKLAAGVSIRKTAAENGALISTVQRIKASMRSPWRRRQVRSGLPAGGRWIRTSGTADDARLLADLYAHNASRQMPQKGSSDQAVACLRRLGAGVVG